MACEGVGLVVAGGFEPCLEREFFIDNLLVRIHVIIVMIRWTGLAPREFEFPFPGSLTSIHVRWDGSGLERLSSVECLQHLALPHHRRWFRV